MVHNNTSRFSTEVLFGHLQNKFGAEIRPTSECMAVLLFHHPCQMVFHATDTTTSLLLSHIILCSLFVSDFLPWLSNVLFAIKAVSSHPLYKCTRMFTQAISPSHVRFVKRLFLKKSISKHTLSVTQLSYLTNVYTAIKCLKDCQIWEHTENLCTKKDLHCRVRFATKLSPLQRQNNISKPIQATKHTNAIFVGSIFQRWAS